MSEYSEYKVVGQRVPRVDAFDKVTGNAKYSADVILPGMLHGAFVRCPYPHARILSINAEKAKRLPGVKAIITQKDVPTSRSLFAKDIAHFKGEKVAAIAAIDDDIAKEAAELVEVEYEPLIAIVDVIEAVKEGAPQINSASKTATAPDGRKLNNIAGENQGGYGDVEAGFKESDLIVEDTYYIPRVHQAYMEPHAVVAKIDGVGKVTVWTSTQGPFAIRSGVAGNLGLPMSKVNVIATYNGGGFGAKFGMLVHPYAVILSQITGKPVRIVFSREEEFLDGRPAPGAVIWLKTGAKKEGRIIARQAIAYWDTGASPGASIGATGRIRGVYKFPNIKFNAYAVYTNTPGPAAYRAPGAPQATFASETQLDRVARELGVDPIELRLINMQEAGEALPSGGKAGKVAFKETIKAVAEQVDWKNRKKDENEGWGVAVGEWTNGAGPGGACVSVHEDGSVKVFYGLMDITGTDTACAQIAAEVLGVKYEDVSITRGDTDSAPYATGSGGSVVTFSMGNAVKRAAEDAKERVLELASEQLGAPKEELELRDKKVWVKEDENRSITLAEVAAYSLSTVGGPIVGSGSFARQPSGSVISAQVCKVKVDPETGKIKILELAGSLDCGKAINPMAVEGQMEGGLVQGLAWGVMEEMMYNDKGNLNSSFVDYRIPTASDLPSISSIIVEAPSDNGPFGVKGVGEPPITPTMAALASAVADAVGVYVNQLPITPEKVVKALKEKKKGIKK